VKYEEYRNRSHFNKEELLGLAHGTLLEDAPETYKSRLPAPPMLMIDRVTSVTRNKNKGRIVAEKDVSVDDWFFQCHFLSDPVQPGCLGVDGVWQLVGFYIGWNGGLGAGRALGCGEVEFSGQIRPFDSVMRYEVDIVRYSELPASGSAIAIGNAVVFIDDEPIYEVKKAKVGLFKDIEYPDYPMRSKNSRGGRLE
jgi:3-hydroxyacyl-[acyl-carrier protein] dehydratase/trans-2-decenoyl-[acyl-carrier protein] isomerase